MVGTTQCTAVERLVRKRVIRLSTGTGVAVELVVDWDYKDEIGAYAFQDS